jgi:hypothetical protein
MDRALTMDRSISGLSRFGSEARTQHARQLHEFGQPDNEGRSVATLPPEINPEIDACDQNAVSTVSP